MEDDLKNKLWGVGGGKGGVGKSIVTLLLGTMLAKHGKKVVLVDADLGGSNLHTLLGIRYPEYTLADFLQRRAEKIEDVIIDTKVNNLQLICGADDILGFANPKNSQKARMFNHLKKIPSDFILLDLGAGISFTTIDFFLYAPNKIVIITPQHTSIQNSYGFIKSSLYRKISQEFKKDVECMKIIERSINPKGTEKIESIDELRDAFWIIGEEKYRKLNNCLNEFNIDVIVNMVKNKRDINVGKVIQSVAENYLNLNIEYPGHINYDHILENSINDMSDFLTTFSNSIFGDCLFDIADKMIRKSKGHETISASGVDNQKKPDGLTDNSIFSQNQNKLTHTK